MLVLSGATSDVTDLAFSPNGTLIAASGGGRGLEVWDTTTGEKWGQYAASLRLSDGPIGFHPTRPFGFAPTVGGLAVFATDTRKARVIEVPCGCWALTPDGASFVAAVRNGIQRFHWGPGSGRKVAVKPGAAQVREGWTVRLTLLTARSRRSIWVKLVRVAPDGSWFLTIDAGPSRTPWWVDRMVRVSVHSLADGSLLRSARLPEGTIAAAAVAPDGGSFVTCRDHVVEVWDASNLKAKRREVRCENRSRVKAVAFHPSGKLLAAASNDTTVRLYDTTTWKPATVFTWNVGRLRSVTFSPDGTRAAVGSDAGTVVVWDVDL